MENSKIKVVVFPCNPTQKPYETEIEHDLHTMQNLVGGYIEPLRFCPENDDFIAVLDEEGLLKRLPINCKIGNVVLVGNVFICRNDKSGEFTSVNDGDFELLVKKYVKDLRFMQKRKE